MADDRVGGVQERPGIGDDRQVDIAQAADLPGIDLDMDQLRPQRREPRPRAQGEEAKPHPQGQDGVRLSALGLQVVHLVEGAAVEIAARRD